MLMRCAAGSTKTATFCTASLSFCATFGGAVTAVESNDEEGEEHTNYDELDDVESFAEAVGSRSWAIEGVVTWWARRTARVVE